MKTLAINGGKPIRTDSFPIWPHGGELELKQLTKVVKSGCWGTLGDEALKFAEKFAKYQDAEYGISVHNGTVSLELIMRGLDIGYGDEVIVPAYTFISTATSVAMAGATPVFADIESNTYNIDPISIEANITPRTKAVIVVHLGGRSCGMDTIVKIARKHDLYIIEDAAHAHGSEWKGQRIGSIGDASSFSFQNSKNLACGEGGAIITNSYDYFKKFWHYHNSGRSYELGSEFGGEIFMGTNARMSEWGAAILNAQLDRMDEQIARRMENAQYLGTKLKEFDFIRLLDDDDRITRNSYHLFIIRYDAEKIDGISRDKFLSAIRAEGIPCQNGYVPLYKMGAFNTPNFRKSIGTKRDYTNMFLENTERAYAEEAIWIPGNVLLGSRRDMDSIIDAFDKISSNIDQLV